MYGADEPSTPSPPIRSQVQAQQQQSREVYVGDDLPPRSNSMRKKSKQPAPSPILPSITASKTQNSSPPSISEQSRSFSVTGDDIEAAFDAINDYKTSTHDSSNNRNQNNNDLSSPDSLFGLSTIKEAIDHDEGFLTKGKKTNQDEQDLDEIDFDSCFDKYKAQYQTKFIEEKSTKGPAPAKPTTQTTPKKDEISSTRQFKEPKRAAPKHVDEPQAPPAMISTPKIETTPTITHSTIKQLDSISNHFDDPNDSIYEDVDELLGKLEVSSAIVICHTRTHTYIHTYVQTLQTSFYA